MDNTAVSTINVLRLCVYFYMLCEGCHKITLKKALKFLNGYDLRNMDEMSSAGCLCDLWNNLVNGANVIQEDHFNSLTMYSMGTLYGKCECSGANK